MTVAIRPAPRRRDDRWVDGVLFGLVAEDRPG